MYRPLAVVGLLPVEERADSAIINAIVPQGVFSAAAEQGSVRPAWVRSTKAAYRWKLGLVLSERRITHSASLRATGSLMLASAALASASFPLRVLSITRFTAAMSASEVADVGAIAKGPEVGRASGLKNARLSNIAPCRPTLACAKEERPAFGADRFCGSGVAEGAIVAGARGLLAGVDDWSRAGQRNFLCRGRDRFGRQRARRQRQKDTEAAATSRFHSTSLLSDLTPIRTTSYYALLGRLISLTNDSQKSAQWDS